MAAAQAAGSRGRFLPGWVLKEAAVRVHWSPPPLDFLASRVVPPGRHATHGGAKLTFIKCYVGLGGLA